MSLLTYYFPSSAGAFCSLPLTFPLVPSQPISLLGLPWCSLSFSCVLFSKILLHLKFFLSECKQAHDSCTQEPRWVSYWDKGFSPLPQSPRVWIFFALVHDPPVHGALAPVKLQVAYHSLSSSMAELQRGLLPSYPFGYRLFVFPPCSQSCIGIHPSLTRFKLETVRVMSYFNNWTRVVGDSLSLAILVLVQTKIHSGRQKSLSSTEVQTRWL